jgi:hypothetical protein
LDGIFWIYSRDYLLITEGFFELQQPPLLLLTFFTPLYCTQQLNFYSFRKINRERNVWIYKHKLFHRDRPEDLFQVRRRTCPGVDGRKQRFSRHSAQKLSKHDEDKTNNSSDDESSLDDTSGDESELVATSSKKRRGSVSSVASSNSKRSRRLWQGDSEKSTKVDNSILPESPTSVFDAPKAPSKALTKDLEGDDDSSANKKSDRMEMMERSLIVSEVATKLEEYVKKALKGRGASRSRRAGVVTPPYGFSRSPVFSSRDLITYDDEYDQEEDLCGLVTDGEESLASADDSLTAIDDDSKNMDMAPIANSEKVQQIVDEIRKRASINMFNSKMIDACADVAAFLMTTAPGEDAIACCNKVLDLLASSDRLATDFHLYRTALHPNGAILSSGQRYSNDHKVSLRRALESGSSRVDALREFKIFAVNLIYKLLGKNGSFEIKQPFSHSESANLLLTADAWSKSVGWVA